MRYLRCGFGEEIVNEAIFFCDNFYNATCVSMGNPNCVLMLEEVNPKKAKQIGPYVENSEYSPNRINMQTVSGVRFGEIIRIKYSGWEPGILIPPARAPARRQRRPTVSGW